MIPPTTAPAGKLAEYRTKGEVSREIIEKGTEYVNVISSLFKLLSESFTAISGMNWTPQHCWHFAGGDWTVMVAGNRAYWVETQKADMGKLVSLFTAEMEEMAATGI